MTNRPRYIRHGRARLAQRYNVWPRPPGCHAYGHSSDRHVSSDMGINPSPLRKRAYTTHQMSRVKHHRHLIWVSLYTTTAMQVRPVDLGCLSQRSLDVPRFSVRHSYLSCHARRWSAFLGNGRLFDGTAAVARRNARSLSWRRKAAHSDRTTISAFHLTTRTCTDGVWRSQSTLLCSS